MNRPFGPVEWRFRPLEDKLRSEIEMRPKIAENYNQVAQKYWRKYVESDMKDLEAYRKMAEYETQALGEYRIAVICEMWLEEEAERREKFDEKV